MSLMHVSSPHVHKPVSSVEQVMKQVLLATIPGVLVLTWFFGPGTLINIVFGSALALAFEAWALWLRGKDYKSPLKDHSVVVTATLLLEKWEIGAPWTDGARFEQWPSLSRGAERRVPLSDDDPRSALAGIVAKAGRLERFGLLRHLRRRREENPPLDLMLRELEDLAIQEEWEYL